MPGRNPLPSEKHLSRSTSTALAAIASLLLGACGSGQEGQPLSVFTTYRLAVGTSAWVKDGGAVDADNYEVTLILYPPAFTGGAGPPCLAISPEVTATLDGQVMHSYAKGSGRGLGGCTEPVFSLLLPKSRYGREGGNGHLVLSDATHRMSAEFKDFYVPVPVEKDFVATVLSCEGVAECTGYRRFSP